jgi:cystathionine beta-synthase
MGTGGTITGTSRYLKEKNPKIRVVGVDPEGSIYSGDMAAPYKVEGIGEDFIPRSADLKMIDEFVRVGDRDSFVTGRRLAREEGLLVGGSCGTAVFAALQISQNLTENDVVVVLLPDGGRGYLSKMYSEEWMRDNGFIPAPEYSYYASDLLDRKTHHGKVPNMITVKADDNVQSALAAMQKHGIDQLPVINDAGQNVGHINDVIVMQVVYERKDPSQVKISSVMGRACPQFDIKSEIDQLYKAFRLGAPMVVLTKDNKAEGVLTKFDIMAHLRAYIDKKTAGKEQHVGASR